MDSVYAVICGDFSRSVLRLSNIVLFVFCSGELSGRRLEWLGVLVLYFFCYRELRLGLRGGVWKKKGE